MSLRRDVGFYRLPAELQKRTVAQNGYGESTEEWVTVSHIRCSIEPINGKEFYAVETVNSELTHRVRLRHAKSLVITPDMRILYNNRILIITSVIDYLEQHEEVQLMCKELVGNG